MALQQKIKEDLNLALKNRDDLKRVVLSSLIAALHNKEIEKRTTKAREMPLASAKELGAASELTEEEVIKVIQSEIKKRKEAIELYEKGSRKELAQKEKDELAILTLYAPKPISEEELRKIVQETIKETGASQIKDMGRVIKVVMDKVKGQAEGSKVSEIVKEQLTR